MNGEFERLIGAIFESPARATALSNRAWTPPLDIWETEGELVYAFGPAYRREKIDVELEDSTLAVSRLARAQRAGGWAPLPLRASFGGFTRSVALPEGTDDVEAPGALRQQVLEVHVEKREQSSRARSGRRPSRAVPPTSLHSRDVRRSGARRLSTKKPSYATAFPAAAANDHARVRKVRRADAPRSSPPASRERILGGSFKEVLHESEAADRCLIVEVLDEEELTVSGIVLPDTAKEKPQRGKVATVGPGARSLETGGIHPDGSRRGRRGDLLQIRRHRDQGRRRRRHPAESDILAKVVTTGSKGKKKLAGAAAAFLRRNRQTWLTRARVQRGRAARSSVA